jgi:MFS family permease
VTSPTAARPAARPDLLSRLQSAIPLASVYFGLAALYAWQASRHPVPTIFTDELELTQLSRAISETGEPARRGEPYGLATLVAYFLAPAWWLASSSTAYAAAKLLLVLAMTATLFPAYALARLVVSPWYALAAGAGAAAVPALAYSPILVEEPLAYPVSTLALWLVARALAEPRWSRLGVAAAAAVVAALTRTQLAILLGVLVLGLLWLGWESEAVRRWRAEWTRWDWAGAVMLAVGAALGFSALVGHYSTSWRNTTGFYKDRVLDHGTWALGALAIGIGIVPMLVGIAALARPRSEPRDPRTRAFVATSVAALAVFIGYAAIKGAYLSTVYGTVIVERNLIYLAPVLFGATALAVERGVGRTWAIAAAAVFTVYVVASTPLQLDRYPNYEAHGLSIAALANRELEWPEGRIEAALLVVCALALAVVLALRRLRRGSHAYRVLAGATAAFVLAWGLTAQVYAAEGERDLSSRIANNLAKPFDWVERETGGESVVVIGQQITDPTGVWLTEFFNPSIGRMWSLDGTAPGPGPILTPDLEAADGTLTPSPESEYALALNGIELQAPVVARRRDDRLYRIDGGPMKLSAAVTGQSSDGWLVGTSEEQVARGAYTRYDVSRDGPGFALLTLSRLGWCPSPPGETTATVRIGPVGIGPDRQPTIASVTAEKTVTLEDCTTAGVALVAPDVPWRLEVEVAPTVSPHEVDPSNSERRELGATMRVGFRPLFGGDS